MISATKVLKKDGILAIITFHSLEDKIVKYFFKSLSEKKKYFQIYAKIRTIRNIILICLKKKPITPSTKELKENISSRSAKLRYVIKKDDVYKFETDIYEKFQYLIEIENIGNKL